MDGGLKRGRFRTRKARLLPKQSRLLNPHRERGFEPLLGSRVIRRNANVFMALIVVERDSENLARAAERLGVDVLWLEHGAGEELEFYNGFASMILCLSVSNRPGTARLPFGSY